MSAKIEGFENYTIYENGDIYSRVRRGGGGHFLAQNKDSNGYYKVNLYKSSKHFNKYVHRLVGLAFIPNPENKPCIDHIDRNKTNNNLNNLRWATYSENNYNKNINKGCILIHKEKKGDKVYESIRFVWYVNGKTKNKNFKTIEEAKRFQLLSFCFQSWKRQ